MSEAGFGAPGSPIEIEALAVPKARQLAEFLQSGPHASARLMEVRLTEGADRTETVVLEVDVEVGQVPLHDIRPVERMAVSFSESDRSWPQVLALRADFPRDVPHLFPRIEEEACSLCLYEDSYEELKLRWTAVKVVERIRFWLRETSRSSLHGSDQPLEPLFVGGSESLVVPSEIFSGDAGTPEQLTVFFHDQGSHRNVYVATRGVRTPGTAVGSFVATVFVAAPRTQRAIRFAPRSLLELQGVAQAAGLDLLGELRARLPEWQRNAQFLGSRLILIVAFPKVRDGASSVEAADLWAFGTVQSLTEIGEALSLWQVTASGVVGALVGVTFDTQKAADIALTQLNPYLTLSREMAAAANGVAADARKMTAIGMGALGSQIVGTLIRMGCGQWKFIDDDVFLPHNAARHELPHSAVGWTKVRAITDWANRILACPVADEGVVADVLEPGSRSQAVAEALETADIIADFSANQAVARHLARNGPRKARCVSSFMNPSGTDVVVLAEDAQRQVRIDAVEMQYYRLLLEEGELAEHFKIPEGRIRTARSCRDISTILPADAVAHNAAVAGRGFRLALSEEEASIRVWRSDPDFNTRMFQQEVAPPIEYKLGSFRLVTDEGFVASVRAQRSLKLPKETGGVLLGSWDLQRRIVYVVATIASPDDSEEYPTSYIRGCAGLKSAVDSAGARTGGQLQYVGEWHSHPDEHSVAPSDKDAELFAWLRDYITQDGYVPVMLIVGQSELGWFVGSL